MVKIIQKVTLSVANHNVNPRQLFSYLVRRYHFENMVLNNLIKPFIARKAIRLNFGLWVQTIRDNHVEGFRLKVRHYSHFEIFTFGILPAILRVFDFLGLGHYQHKRLFFAIKSPLQFLVLFAYRGRFNYSKESFFLVRKTQKFISFISGTHRHSCLLQHIPNRLISPSPKLPLHFFGRNAFLGRGHQIHSNEPTSERKGTRFYYDTVTHGGSSSALFTLKLLNRFHPIMGNPFTISISKVLFLTLFLKILPTRFLFGKLFEKNNKLHIYYFDKKLLRMNVTYLRFGT